MSKEMEQEFNLELIFKSGNTIKLENVKSEEVFQRIQSSCPDFPHSKDLIDQYVDRMKRQTINETIKLLVDDGKYKTEDWYRLISTRIK